MSESQQRGWSCEERALQFYQALGYSIIARNHKISGIEVDLVLFKNHLVIVEVKSLRSLEEISFRVSPRQLQRLLRARQILQTSKGKLVELKFLYVSKSNKCLELDIADHL